MKRSCLLFISGACLPLLASAPVFAANPDSTEFSVEVKPYLNVTLSDADIHLPITPSSTGTFGSANLTASASTNSALGYALVLSYLDSSDNLNTDLVSNTLDVNNGTYPTIPTFTTNDELTSTAFSASTSEDHLNHWAISVDDTNHYKKAVQGATIATSDGPIADDTTTINLATKLDLRTTPGSYSVIMNFQVVANPDPITTLGDALQNAGKTPVTIGNEEYYKIQDIDTSICNVVNDTTSTLQVVDVRDNSIYAVGKLDDNRCWLLDNLILDLTAANASTNINASNTNASATALNALFNGGGTASSGYAVNGVTSWDTNPILSYSNHELYGNTPLFYTSLKDTVTSDSSELDALKNVKFGFMYNYCAASAGSYCYGNETEASTPTDVVGTAIDSPYDICPAGWRMPTGDTYDANSRPEGGEIEALYDAYNGDGYDIRTALRLPLSGDYEFRNYSEHDQNSLGYFWTSTWYDSPDSWLVGEVMYIPYIFNNNVYPRNYGNRFSYGYSVRCIVK